VDRRTFEIAIMAGFERIYALSLPGSPDPDALELVISTWTDTLWSTAAWEDLDQARIDSAFRSLARHCERWPAPSQFIAALPPRAQVQTAEEPMSDEQIAHNKRRIAELLETLAKKKT